MLVRQRAVKKAAAAGCTVLPRAGKRFKESVSGGTQPIYKYIYVMPGLSVRQFLQVLRSVAFAIPFMTPAPPKRNAPAPGIPREPLQEEPEARRSHRQVTALRTSRPRWCCILAALLLAAGSSRATPYDALLHRSYAQRSLAFDTLLLPRLRREGRPQLLRQLEDVRQLARRAGDPGLELEADLWACNYRYGWGLVSTDEKIAFLQRRLRSMDQDAYPEYAARILADLGNNYYGKKHDYIRAFDCYNRAYQLVRPFEATAFPQKKALLTEIGNRYYTLGDLDRAFRILQEANRLPADRAVPHANYNNKNTLGLIYRSRGRYDSALRYFEMTGDLARADGDTVWAAIAGGNMGLTAYLQGRYQQAIPLLRADVKYSFTPGENAVNNGLTSLLTLAAIHLKLDSLDAVADDLQLAFRYLDSAADRARPRSMLYPILARYRARLGDMGGAYAALDSGIRYSDSVRHRDDLYQVARVAHRHELEQQGVRLQRLVAEKRLAVYTRNGLLVGCLLVGCLAALVVSRQRLRHTVRQQALQAEYELAAQSLQHARGQLEAYVRHLQEKNTLLEKSAQELSRLRLQLSDTQQAEDQHQILQQLHASTILTDEEWARFSQLFDRVHKGYLHRLREKFPDLTAADTRFIVLSKLNLSNKEMAGILGVQVDTIRGHKHRLRKRLGLADDGAIGTWIQAV